jgi:hypothetical protein
MNVVAEPRGVELRDWRQLLFPQKSRDETSGSLPQAVQFHDYDARLARYART